MLIELRIENLAVIDKLAVRLDAGLNVLTGETGAGKSIIVGALSLLLGERASAESVRTGAARAVVEGVFDVTAVAGVRSLLNDRGIDTEDDLVILRREIAVEGRSRAWVNGSASTAAFVGEIGRLLVDLHGQHEHQSLLQPGEQREILDAFGACADLSEQAQSVFARVRELQAELESLERRQREISARAELLRFQTEEIEKARLRTGEETELELEAHRLSHAEELARLAGTLHEQLYAAENAVASRIDELRRVLTQLLRLDPAVAEAQRTMDEAYFALQELGREMGDYSSRVEEDPARLEQIRVRLDQLYRLKTRYGGTIEAAIEAGQRARLELVLLDDATAGADTLRLRIAEARAEHQRVCALLSQLRCDAAARLDQEMNVMLPELGMPGGHFVTALTPLAEPAAHGQEAVEFRVSVNAGFEPGPLSRVASGGELSRIMLALKSILARQDRVPTLIFDEIDAGIGGLAAHRVAERLRTVARAHQVCVVTHLAQVASRADHHFLVEKNAAEGRASARISELHADARVHEVARLLGGDPESSISQAHARELLGSASD